MSIERHTSGETNGTKALPSQSANQCATTLAGQLCHTAAAPLGIYAKPTSAHPTTPSNKKLAHRCGVLCLWHSCLAGCRRVGGKSFVHSWNVDALRSAQIAARLMHRTAVGNFWLSL